MIITLRVATIYIIRAFAAKKVRERESNKSDKKGENK